MEAQGSEPQSVEDDAEMEAPETLSRSREVQIIGCPSRLYAETARRFPLANRAGGGEAKRGIFMVGLCHFGTSRGERDLLFCSSRGWDRRKASAGVSWRQAA